MKIELQEITIRELYEGYENNDDEGVVGYGGKLNIRPKYQREYVYPNDKRDAVINTVYKNFPLNVMYWVQCNDGTFELLDGQQRTISICEYVQGNFSIPTGESHKYFHSLKEDESDNFLNYKLMVYFCEGTPSEQLDWFKVINIAGLKLSDQELRNAMYTGTWLSDAKRYFSKRNCPAYIISSDYVNVELDRQGYLELAIKWFISGKEEYKGFKDPIAEYMSKYQNELNANELWMYYNNVFTWVKMTFPKFRKQMKGLPWGEYYNKFHEKAYDAKTLEAEIVKLMKDVDVTKKSGIYLYLLSGDERYLSIRDFDDDMKSWAYENQKGICPKCGKHFEYEEMHGDHITPWHAGGKTIADNCQMLCADCNRRKSGI